MPNLFLLFNHQLTAAQRAAAGSDLGVRQIIHPPPEVRSIWSNIPPEETSIFSFLAPVRSWLEAEAGPGDFVLIQGDFGACYLMVNFAFEKGLVPVYSTTSRVAREERQADGGVRLVHTFNHVRYRKYVR